MYIKSLQLENFRNYENLDIDNVKRDPDNDNGYLFEARGIKFAVDYCKGSIDSFMEGLNENPEGVWGGKDA